jgi:hypothetical protein
MNNLKVGLSLIALLGCVSLLLMGAAQDTKETSQLTRYVTGCIEKGHDANEYHLIAESANWHLRSASDNVRLSDHVGHKVKIAGAVSNQPFHGMKVVQIESFPFAFAFALGMALVRLAWAS